MNYTPGPWHYDEHTDNIVATDTPDDGGDIICVGLSEGGDSPSRRRWNANASLISAAPDLLEALETIMKYPSIPNTIGYEMVDTARAAIAKARGQ